MSTQRLSQLIVSVSVPFQTNLFFIILCSNGHRLSLFSRTSIFWKGYLFAGGKRILILWQWASVWALLSYNNEHLSKKRCNGLTTLWPIGSTQLNQTIRVKHYAGVSEAVAPVLPWPEADNVLEYLFPGHISVFFFSTFAQFGGVLFRSFHYFYFTLSAHKLWITRIGDVCPLVEWKTTRRFWVAAMFALCRTT